MHGTIIAVESFRMNPRKILVVDDDQLIGWALEKGLVGENLRLSVVETGHEALLELERDRYNMVLLDIHLPDVNGLDLLCEIRRKSPDSRIVVTSADSTDGNKEKAISRGANQFLEKPFTISIVRDLLRSEIGEYPQKRKHERYICNIPLSVELLGTLPGDPSNLPDPLGANALDVGKAGVRLAVDHLLSAGQKLLLFKTQEDGILARFIPPRVTAEVVWVSPDANGCTAGLKFAS